MAINPETEKKTTATIDYKDYEPSGRTTHKFIRRNHVDPWLGWSAKNRLESTWNMIIKGAKGKKPFEVEKKKVGSGTGKTKVKWTVWDKSDKLSNLEVELYSVMRAENKYIKEGYVKTASKYTCTFTKKTKSGQ